MRAFGVVTDVGTDSKLETLVLIWKMESHRKIMLKTRIVQECNFSYFKYFKWCMCMCTATGVVSDLVEAWFAGAEGVCAIGDTVGFIAIATLSPVAPTVI